MVDLYPKTAFPDFITSWRRELIDSTAFFVFFPTGAIVSGRVDLEVVEGYLVSRELKLVLHQIDVNIIVYDERRTTQNSAAD